MSVFKNMVLNSIGQAFIFYGTPNAGDVVKTIDNKYIKLSMKNDQFEVYRDSKTCYTIWSGEMKCNPIIVWEDMFQDIRKDFY